MTHPSSRLTAPQRLRLAVARLVGERTLRRIAVAILPSGYGVVSDGYVDSVEGQATWWKHRTYAHARKRRRLVARLWSRRRERADQAMLDYLFADEPVIGAETICQPGAAYGPASACVLTRGPATHNGEEEG